MLLAFVMLITSCSYFSMKSNKVEDKLIGRWVLDSVLSARNEFYKNDNNDRRILIFKDRSNYSFESWNGDVGNKSQGSYFIQKNPNHKLNTITFIPDLQFEGGDTIRQYMNYDVIAISDTSLLLIEETKFIPPDRLPYTVYNKQYIYKIRK